MENDSTEQKIKDTGNEIINMLIAKNRSYGDSALNPTNVFSKLDSIEAIKVRIDDKLTRIKNKGITGDTEDTVSDLIGYLILLKIKMKCT